MAVYLLDTNVFVEAKNGYYGFDIAPSFWTWLDDRHADGHLSSIRPVMEELEEGRDDLAGWAADRKSAWGARVDGVETQKAYTEVVNWVMDNPQFKLPGKNVFLARADPWLIAHAMVLGATVVTHEKYDPVIRKKVPIPNVCRQFEVPDINTFQLMRILGASI